jgi:HPt (histidine-containing phosphotransfer) domain-containing protein
MLEKWIPKEKQVKSGGDVPSLAGKQDSLAELEIPGVDIKRGIAMTGGTVEGYIKVLELYCRDAEKRLEILSNAPDESGFASFTRQVHALKSASASIGMAEMSRMASELEEAGKNGDAEFIHANLNAFLEQLTARIERIKAAISRETAISFDAGRQDICESLNLLKNALASENVGDADKIIAGLSGAPLDKDIRDSLSSISDLVLLGEFKEALAIAGNIGT